MNRKRFTLIELLAVMAIMAILAAALLAALGGMRDVAKRRQSETEMNNIAAVCHQFYIDYRQLPTPERVKGKKVKYGTSSYSNDDVDVAFLGEGEEPRQHNDISPTTWSESQSDLSKWGGKCTWWNEGSTQICFPNKALSTGYLQLFDILCATNLEGGSSKEFVLASEKSREINERCTQYLKPKPQYFNTDKTTQGFRDPWGQPYIVILDTNYDMVVPYPAYLVSTGANKVTERVGVICFKWDENAKAAKDNFTKIGKPMPHSWKD